MPIRQYVCAECCHLFGPPEGMSRDTRSLMCPACGSNDLMISGNKPAPSLVMRARTPVMAGDEWRVRKDKAS